MRRRAIILVLDGVGMRAADAAAYGDVGSDTLGNLCHEGIGGLTLPNLQRARAGEIALLEGVAPTDAVRRRVGRDAARVGWKGQYDGTLGNCRTSPTTPVSDLSPRLSREGAEPHPRARPGRGVLGNMAASGKQRSSISLERSTSARESGSCTPPPIPSFRLPRTKASFRSRSCITPAKSLAVSLLRRTMCLV